MAEQSGYDAHAAARVRVEPPADGVAALDDAAATADFSLEAEMFALVDQTVRSRATRPPEIRIDRSERVAVTSGARSRGVFLASLAGASAASLGLAWLVIAGLGSPFDLTSITKLGAHRVVGHEAAPPLPAQTAIAPAPVVDGKADRGQTSRPVAREADQKAHPPAPARSPEPPAKSPEGAAAKSPGPAPAKSADGPDLFSSTAMTRWKPSLGSSAPAPSAGHHAAAPHPHPHPDPVETAAAPPQPEPRITTPAPETRPTTIPGWTLREIVNGTAVVDGPGGSFRVARGDTVPGVGRVLAIFRWGNRSMVATSQGLISTP